MHSLKCVSRDSRVGTHYRGLRVVSDRKSCFRQFVGDSTRVWENVGCIPRFMQFTVEKQSKKIVVISLL